MPDSNKECPSCGKETVTWEDRKDIFPYGLESEPIWLGCMVPVGTCPECHFEFTDHRAENIKDAMVTRLLQLYQRKEDLITGKRKAPAPA